jgi:lipopolysaccharide export system protein LptA
MFDGNVHVDDDEYQMCSKQLYVFLDGTNELKRIVAIGDVAITNETRHGSCAKAAYTKSAGKVVMYGDGKGTMAKLVDEGKRRSEVEGKKITFWIDSEQVEVEGSTVTLDAGGLGGKDGAKKLLGK